MGIYVVEELYTSLNFGEPVVLIISFLYDCKWKAIIIEAIMKKNVNNTLNMEVNIDINAYNNNRLGHFLQ